MLTKNIASEYGQYNIQCNGIGPGYIATPQTAPLRETQEKRRTSSIRPIYRWTYASSTLGRANRIWLGHLSSWLLAHRISLTAMSCM